MLDTLTFLLVVFWFCIFLHSLHVRIMGKIVKLSAMTMQMGYLDCLLSNLTSYSIRMFVLCVLVIKMELSITDNEYN